MVRYQGMLIRVKAPVFATGVEPLALLVPPLLTDERDRRRGFWRGEAYHPIAAY